MIDSTVIETIRPLIGRMNAVERLELIRIIVATGPPSSRSEVNLAERGISPEQAADLRTRLRTFMDDWDDPTMEAYNAL